jgi:hypothetical protein
MTTQSLIVGVATGTGTERVPVRGDRTEWTHDDTLLVFDDDTQIAEFPAAQWVVRSNNLEG